MSSSVAPYPYPVSNSGLVKHLNLQPHFEGGFFLQTVAVQSLVPDEPTWPKEFPKSDVVQGRGREQQAWGSGTTLLGGPETEQSLKGKDVDLDATVIYYLITPGSQAKAAMNVHPHFHLHHAGRALYTLIRPPSPEHPLPLIKRVFVGPHVDKGEVTQFFVPGGWWKASEIPDDDMELVKAGKIDEDHIGCLISEVVVPGWVPQQFQFITEDKLKEMWAGKDGWQEYLKYVPEPQS